MPLLALLDVGRQRGSVEAQPIADAGARNEFPTGGVARSFVFALGQRLAVEHVTSDLDGINLLLLVAVERDYHRCLRSPSTNR